MVFELNSIAVGDPCGSSVLYLESMLNLSIPRDTEQQRKCRKGEFDCLQIPDFLKEIGDIVVVIVWKLDLQLHMQSLPITTNVMSSNPAQARCTRYNM